MVPARFGDIEIPYNKTICRVGVIDLPLIYEPSDPNANGAALDTARLIAKLREQGISGLILDLRRNGGGSVQEAIGVAGLFIPAGPVVQTRDKNGRRTASSPEPKAFYSGPLVVLTSRFSASAAEIVAGAFQDYGRALIVGDACTFGKGTMQILVPFKTLLHFSGFGAVKVTVAQLYRPNGSSTQMKGVVPDIILPSETDGADIGEARLPNALPWDFTPGAIHTNFNLVIPALASLRENSQARVASVRCFRLLRKEVAVWAAEETNALSLNESRRRRDKADLENLQPGIKKAWQAECSPARQVYDITVEEATDAGGSLEHGPDIDPDLNEPYWLCSR